MPSGGYHDAPQAPVGCSASLAGHTPVRVRLCDGSGCRAAVP
jgi:hypothetical protein